MHPVHTEVVANVKSRDEILGALFFLASLWVWRRSGKFNILLSAALFFLALLSKETYLAVFPSFFLLNYLIKDNSKSWTQVALATVLPVVVYIGIRLLVLDASGVNEGFVNDIYNNSLAGANGVVQHVATRVYLQWLYFKKSLLPTELLYDYSYKHIDYQSFTSIGFLLGLLVVGGLAYLLVKTFKSKDELSLGLLIYVLGLALVSNVLITIPALFAERFLFLPSLGMMLIAVLGLHRLTASRNILLFYIPLACLMMFYMSTSIARVGDWSSQLKLFQADVKKAPGNYKINLNLASHYYGQAVKRGSDQDYLKAIKYFKASRNILQYDNTKVLMQFSNAYLRTNQYEQAVPLLLRVVELGGEKGKALINLGLVYEDTNVEKAQGYYEKAFKLRDEIALEDKKKLYKSYGELLAGKAELTRAIEVYNEYLALDKTSTTVWYNMGIVYYQLNNIPEAVRCFGETVRLDPSNEKAKRNYTILKQQL